jgi:hypothetical protein
MRRHPEHIFQGPLDLPLKAVRSAWYADVAHGWTPDRSYIEHLVSRLALDEYVPPIVVVPAEDAYLIVDGHHRVYASHVVGRRTVKAIVLHATFDETRPLREAENLLKQFDADTGWKYCLSGHLARWAAVAEEHSFLSTYRRSFTDRLVATARRVRARL